MKDYKKRQERIIKCASCGKDIKVKDKYKHICTRVTLNTFPNFEKRNTSK